MAPINPTRTAFFVETYDQFADQKTKNVRIGSNTGNILFLTALKSIIDCDVVQKTEKSALEPYSAFITTELIWIRELDKPSERLKKRIELAGDRPVLPISIGLQAHAFKEFTLSPEMVTVLKQLSEKVSLPLRGAYTAATLKRHGIDNFTILGCPSVYQLPLYHESLDALRKRSDANHASANFRTLGKNLSPIEAAIMDYISKNCDGFIEQTTRTLGETDFENQAVIDWFSRNSHMFYDQESWVRHNRRYDFSFGLRFHGNVAALLAGAPALFLTIDSRTREMVEFFSFPHLPFDKFSTNLPLRDHAQNTDYAAFISGYPGKLRGFINYIEGCGVNVRANFKERATNWMK